MVDKQSIFVLSLCFWLFGIGALALSSLKFGLDIGIGISLLIVSTMVAWLGLDDSK